MYPATYASAVSMYPATYASAVSMYPATSASAVSLRFEERIATEHPP